MTGSMVLPARRARRLTRETAARLRQIVYQDDTTAVGNLALFERFDRWTAPLFAAYRGISLETARKRLRDLVESDVVARVAGAVYGHGGREPDLYALAAHGALVLDHVCGRPRNTTRAPQLAVGQPMLTEGDRRILPHVAGGTTPHVLNCLRLALHQGWAGDLGWRIIERLDSRIAEPGGDPIPDFALLRAGQLIAVEVEGTLHRAHINDKHRCYAALASRLCATYGTTFEVFLAVVFTFADVRDCENAQRSHELAFARQGRDYCCYVARLADVLDAPPAMPLWELDEELDREAIRRRESAHHDRLRRLYDDW
jgi:hypothetical protein